MHDEPKPDDAPSGLPDKAEPEASPLGNPAPESQPEPGEEAMPGIPTEGSPPDAG